MVVIKKIGQLSLNQLLAEGATPMEVLMYASHLNAPDKELAEAFFQILSPEQQKNVRIDDLLKPMSNGKSWLREAVRRLRKDWDDLMGPSPQAIPMATRPVDLKMLANLSEASRPTRINDMLGPMSYGKNWIRELGDHVDRQVYDIINEIDGLNPNAIPMASRPLDPKFVKLQSNIAHNRLMNKPSSGKTAPSLGGVKESLKEILEQMNASDRQAALKKGSMWRSASNQVKGVLKNPAMAKFLKVGGNVAMLGFEVWNIMNAEDKAKATFQASHAVPACILGSMMTAAVPNLYGKLAGVIASVAACSAAGISVNALSGVFYDEVNSQVLE